MKTGEKISLQIVLIVFVGIVVFTIYLEMDYRKTSPVEKSSPATEMQKPSPEELEKLSFLKRMIPKGMNPSNLPDADSRGAILLTIYCTQCHELPTPTMHNSAEWPTVLTRMQMYLKTSKGGMLRHVIFPPKKDWPILEDYLLNNAQTSLDPLKYKDINTAAGKAFVSTCSQCHAAPSPESHTKNEWPRVVLRMKSNIIAANMTAPDQKTLLAIIDFLQRHSNTRQGKI